MKRIAVVGAGSAGLSAAWHLERARRTGADVGYTVFEASGRTGGVIQTERVEGCIVEGGPDSFLTEKPWAAEWCRALGLGEELVASNDHQRKTFILVRGRMIELPDGLMFMIPTKLWPMATTPLFSLGSKLRAAREWFLRPNPAAAADETVASFVERHFGREMVERLADPLLAGVYGGSADKLSVAAVLPRFLEMERAYGSLTRAMLAARKKMAGAPARPLFTTLRQGMQQMTDAAAAQLAPGTVRLDAPVWTLRRAGERWAVVTDAGEEQFDGVVLAVPAYRAADLLGSVDEALADELRGISYNSSITVALGYDEAALDARARRNVQGFGFLVPRTEGRALLACTFVQSKFPGRAPAGKLLFRCFIGGEQAEEAMQRSHEELVAAVRAELRDILGLAAEPLFACVSKWRQAMAQYEVGHLERVARIEQRVAALPGLRLIGNGYRGIGVPDCVRGGMEAAASFTAAS